jgi:hypothetical protein
MKEETRCARDNVSDTMVHDGVYNIASMADGVEDMGFVSV